MRQEAARICKTAGLTGQRPGTAGARPSTLSGTGTRGGGHQGTDPLPETNDGTRGRECEWAESLNSVT